MQFLIDDPRAIEAALPAPPLPAAPIGTSVICAHWGDAFYAMSHTKRVLDLMGQPKCDVLYWGRLWEQIPEWLECLPFVDHVYSVPAGGFGSVSKERDYCSFANNTMNRRLPQSEWLSLLPDVPDAPGGRIQNPWCDGIANFWAVYQYHITPMPDPPLPPSRVEKADALLQDSFGADYSDVVLLHPFSTWSSKQEEYWPYWNEAINWLLANTHRRYVLTGLNDFDCPTHQRIVNLIGKTNTNMEVLAMAKLLPITLTVCNSVGHFATAYDKPVIATGCDALRWHVNPFRRLIDRNQTRFIDRYAPFDAFVDAAEQVLG